MGKKVIILGGLGNGSVIAHAIVDAEKRGSDEWTVAGYLNDRVEKGGFIEEFPVLGGIRDAEKYVNEGYYFINTIFRIDGQSERIDLFNQLNIPDESLATFIHPLAYVASNVEFGPGSVVLPNTSLSPSTTFGKCCLIMVNVTIGHNNKIGNYCHFAAQSCVGSYLDIGDGVHVGLNASVRENLKIGKNSTIGMAATLLKDVGENEIWVGSPATFLRHAK